MIRIISLIMALFTVLAVNAETFSYKFNSTPLSQAILKIAEEHPDVDINFIYNELENYKTSARVQADNSYDALRQTIGLNPVTVVKSKNTFYVEALQHGKFCYTGRVIGKDKEPIEAATVLIMEPKDSVVLTYGITNEKGYFNIPCDKSGVIVKITCMGYKPFYQKCYNFSLGTIIMEELPIVLKTVQVEGDNAFLYSDRSVYIPTTRQKNSSQTGLELLQRMAIPQLRSTGSGGIETISGQKVNIYIDYLPATSSDLTGMRMQDVRKVEFYEYPSDPRFHSDPFVVNFIMAQYEYGGYVKVYGDENFIYNSGELVGYLKFQYKRMTYDLSVGGYYANVTGQGMNEREVYRLPQESGEIKEFERISEFDYAKYKNNSYWSTFRATYKTDKISISNNLSVNLDKIPKNYETGEVFYKPDLFSSSPYANFKRNDVKSFVYNGNWNFIFNDKNTLTISPLYSYSHTDQFSDYTVDENHQFLNIANDNSNQAKITANYSHSFRPGSVLNITFPAYVTSNITDYSGTAEFNGKATTYRVYPGGSYGLTKDKYYIYGGLGYSWDRSTYNGITENTFFPWADLSLRYSFNRKNSVNAAFHYSRWNADAASRSEVIIHSNPLFSYTGNPYLYPETSYDYGVSYVFIPNNKFRFSAYYNGWTVIDRYAYNYEPTENGILRTIIQPAGRFTRSQFGLWAYTSLLDGNLQLSATLQDILLHNGLPYNWTKNSFNIELDVYYYLKDFYFGAWYRSPYSTTSNSMSGQWKKERSMYFVQVGWANSDWNLRILFRNFFNKNKKSDELTLTSKWYDSFQQYYSPGQQLWFKVSATYTFGFGKKIQRGNEAQKQTGVSSGILK